MHILLSISQASNCKQVQRMYVLQELVLMQCLVQGHLIRVDVC